MKEGRKRADTRGGCFVLVADAVKRKGRRRCQLAKVKGEGGDGDGGKGIDRDGMVLRSR